ncbi:hypothetical protein ABMA28_006542, partial [Loxostege sticticalis]
TAPEERIATFSTAPGSDAEEHSNRQASYWAVKVVGQHSCPEDPKCCASELMRTWTVNYHDSKLDRNGSGHERDARHFYCSQETQRSV